MHLCCPYHRVPSLQSSWISHASRALALVLVALLVWTPSARAQSSSTIEQIELRTVSGAGAEFLLGSKQKQRLAVQVVNQEEHPLAGVAVTFQLPDDGPSGLFASGQRSFVVFTNDEGEASITGIQWNNTPGAVSIRVTAVKGMAHAGILLPVALAQPSSRSPAPLPDQAVSARTAKPETTPAAQVSDSSPQNQPAQASSPAASAARPLKDPSARSAVTPAGAAAPSVTIDTQPGALRVSHSESASGATGPLSDRPEVTISTPSQARGPSSGKKWLLIALIAGGAAAGVGAALLSKSSGTSSSANTNPISIGSPTVIVSHP